MTPASLNYVSVPVIVRQIVANLKAVMLADGVTPAFGEVVLFDQESLVEAFTWLHLSQQRVCVVIPGEETYEEQAGKGSRLVLSRQLPVMVIVSDRVIGDRTKALYGDPAAQPPILGAYGLQALALPVITGVIVNDPFKAVAKPHGSVPLVVKDKQQLKLPGRSALMIDLEVRGGLIETNIGPGPVL